MSSTDPDAVGDVAAARRDRGSDPFTPSLSQIFLSLPSLLSIPLTRSLDSPFLVFRRFVSSSRFEGSRPPDLLVGSSSVAALLQRVVSVGLIPFGESPPFLFSSLPLLRRRDASLRNGRSSRAGAYSPIKLKLTSLLPPFLHNFTSSQTDPFRSSSSADLSGSSGCIDWTLARSNPVLRRLSSLS